MKNHLFDNAGLDTYWSVKITPLLRKLLTMQGKEVQICLDPWYILISGQPSYRHWTKINFLTDHPVEGEYAPPLPNPGSIFAALTACDQSRQRVWCLSQGLVGQFVWDSAQGQHLFGGWSFHGPSRETSTPRNSAKGPRILVLIQPDRQGRMVDTSQCTGCSSDWEVCTISPGLWIHPVLRLSTSLYPV